MRHLLTVVVLIALAATLSADSIILKSGTSLSGVIVAEHPDRVEIRLESGEVRSVPRDEIAVLRKGATRLDEFRQRLAAVKPDDVGGLLEVARWCGGQRMARQRVQVLRKVVQVAPDCAEARRGLGQVWNGKRWKKDREKGAVESPAAGAKVSCEALGLKLVLPKGFATRESDSKGLRAHGPERYRVPVVLEILESSVAPAARFSAKGWSKPVAEKRGDLEGFRAEREVEKEGRRVRVREHAYRNGPRGFIVRLSALAVEFTDWIPHLDFVIEKMEPTTARPEYVAGRLGIGFNPPKGSTWQVIDHDDGEGGGLLIAHPSDSALHNAVIIYVQTDARDTDGEISAAELRVALQELIQILGGSGDLKNESDSYLGVMDATLWDYEMLSQGIPMRGLFLLAQNGDRIHLLMLRCHERAIDRFRPAFDTVRRSFTDQVK